jgi:gas vesicle protein
MSNRDGFTGGFWLGTIVGGVVGGIVGATIASQRANRLDAETDNGRFSGDGSEKRPLKSSRRRSYDRMELARQSLDAKISDLNNAIDSVRSSIGHTPIDTFDPSLERLNEDVKTQKSIDA